jgi:hypothetical protein
VIPASRRTRRTVWLGCPVSSSISGWAGRCWRAADADEQAEVVRAAQHHRARSSDPAADLVGGQRGVHVGVAEQFEREDLAVLAITAATSPPTDPILAQAVADGPLGHSRVQAHLSGGAALLDVQLDQQRPQVRRLSGAAVRSPSPCPARADLHSATAQPLHDAVPVDCQQRRDTAGGQALARVEVRHARQQGLDRELTAIRTALRVVTDGRQSMQDGGRGILTRGRRCVNVVEVKVFFDYI